MFTEAACNRLKIGALVVLDGEAFTVKAQPYGWAQRLGDSVVAEEVTLTLVRVAFDEEKP